MDDAVSGGHSECTGGSAEGHGDDGTGRCLSRWTPGRTLSRAAGVREELAAGQEISAKDEGRYARTEIFGLEGCSEPYPVSQMRRLGGPEPPSLSSSPARHCQAMLSPQ